MASYQPVDLSAACNVGADVLGDEPGAVPPGRVELRGLPFLIGAGVVVVGIGILATAHQLIGAAEHPEDPVQPASAPRVNANQLR